MSIVRKLHKISIFKTFPTRFYVAAALNKTPNPGPFDEPFPDEPTSAYYDEQVNKAGQNGDMVTVGYLLNKRFRDGCFNTARTFNFLNNDESSLSNLDFLIQTLSRLDKGSPRKQAFDILIARLCKIGRTDEALRVVCTMAEREYGLTASSFHPIVSFLTRKKKMDEAWRVLDLMRDAGVLPDVTTYNFLLTAYCFERKLTEASAVVKKIEAEGLAVDSRTYDALILGACKEGKIEAGLVLLRSMMDAGMQVSYSTDAHLINGMLRQRYFDQAVRFVMICKGRDKKLDEESFGVLANKLINLERKDEAMVVLEEMRRRGFRMGQKLTDFYEMNVIAKTKVFRLCTIFTEINKKIFYSSI